MKPSLHGPAVRNPPQASAISASTQTLCRPISDGSTLMSGSVQETTEQRISSPPDLANDILCAWDSIALDTRLGPGVRHPPPPPPQRSNRTAVLEVQVGGAALRMEAGGVRGQLLVDGALPPCRYLIRCEGRARGQCMPPMPPPQVATAHQTIMQAAPPHDFKWLEASCQGFVRVAQTWCLFPRVAAVL